MAKRNHTMAPAMNQRGQISIFFSASLVVMISIIAFVINIGLFVKAKINLQNATDAAAFSGAAVQARQLSKIAYLNWEMRNVYKEWLFKYYVIGNLNIRDVATPGTSGKMSFKLEEDRNPLTTQAVQDPFNIPAVCIHIAGSQTNICKRYSVPGLPEFGSSNLPGPEEASRAFMDTLISTKVNDCVDRTRLNMTVALTWAYNVLGNSMGDTLTGRGPAILSDRQGAWPKAVELAIRMRNLEFIMNRKAYDRKVCVNGSTPEGLTNCGASINEVMQEQKLGNERLIKAFYSGYRNLGNETDNEMKNSFTLTEIPPKGVVINNKANASNLLVPEPYEKQWVDLKLMMVNYAVFYAAMIPRADTKTSGACDISKVAIPVPGYPLGFYKNPDVVTYYAVKGEAEFLGMFNPFRSGPVKLTAHAAAKPMGGRIGPMLFTQKESQDFMTARTDPLKLRSVPYITSYDFENTQVRNSLYSENGAPGSKEFIPGLPLPTNSNKPPGRFWVDDPNKPIGGLVPDAGGVQFGLPNMVYDYQTPFTIDGYSNAATKVHTIKSNSEASELEIGLFSRFQFNNFRGTAITDTMGPDTLDHEIARVRAPTSYEAANYLIPTPMEFNLGTGGVVLDSFGFIGGKPESLSNGIKRYRGMVFAPLYKGPGNDQTDLLYTSSNMVLTAIYDFMRAQRSGMTKYKMALNRAAIEIDRQKMDVAGGAIGSREGYEKAANGVSDINFGTADAVNDVPKSCASLAGQFLYFYYGGPVLPEDAPPDSPGCPTPMGELLEQYFSKTPNDETYDPTYYAFNLSWNPDGKPADKKTLLSGYAPGPFTGVGMDGTYQNPISGAQDTMRRNFYSTKFITLNSLQSSGSSTWGNTGFAVMSEGETETSGTDTAQGSFRNPADFGAAGVDIDSIKY